MAPSRRRRSSPEAEPIVPTEPPLRGRQMYQPDGPSSVRRDREPRMSLMAIRHPNYYARNPQQEAYFGENRPSLLIRPDLIDKMDTVSELYHHEGPYDAAARERNIFPDQAPMQALQYSTAEALRATPHDMIIDSIRERRPLDGVATLPPGSRDMSGRVLNYKAGANMMVEDRGNFQRHPGAVGIATLIYSLLTLVGYGLTCLVPYTRNLKTGTHLWILIITRKILRSVGLSANELVRVSARSRKTLNPSAPY